MFFHDCLHILFRKYSALVQLRQMMLEKFWRWFFSYSNFMLFSKNWLLSFHYLLSIFVFRHHVFPRIACCRSLLAVIHHISTTCLSKNWLLSFITFVIHHVSATSDLLVLCDCSFSMQVKENYLCRPFHLFANNTHRTPYRQWLAPYRLL